jgi:hypothetical protein
MNECTSTEANDGCVVRVVDAFVVIVVVGIVVVVVVVVVALEVTLKKVISKSLRPNPMNVHPVPVQIPQSLASQRPSAPTEQPPTRFENAVPEHVTEL